MNGLHEARTGEALDRQVFHCDGLVLADQPCGELVVELAPGIGCPCVGAGRVGPVYRALRRSTSHVGRYLWGGHFWSGSYFTGSCGGAPLTVLNQYIENQKRPA
ncbi:transposase [Streptomyces zhihengii]